MPTMGEGPSSFAVSDGELKKPSSKTVHICASEPEMRLEVNDLRGRLIRRNAVLDSVRKAYHHDVLVVKEYLSQLRKDGKLDVDVDDPLASVPSLDLRPALKLFAPAECELRLRPCTGCGGQLEIVHRESARVATLQRAVADLQAVEQDLRMRLSRAEVRGGRDAAEREVLREKSREDVAILAREIRELKGKLLDYDAMAEERRRLRTGIAKLRAENGEHRKSLLVLDGRTKDLALSREEVAQLSREIENRDATIRELTCKLQGATNRNQDLETYCCDLTSEILTLKENKSSLQEQLSAFRNRLSKCQAAKDETEVQLDASRKAGNELKAELTEMLQSHQSELSKMEQRNQHLTDTVEDLEAEVLEQVAEKENYRKEIEQVTQSLKSQTESREGLDEEKSEFGKELANLQNEISALTESTVQLTNFACSYARNIYDHCVAQEVIVANEGSRLPESRNKVFTEGSVGNIMKHLQRGYDSSNIAWDDIISNETERRKIMGLMSNRLQMGLFSIEKIISSLHKKRDFQKRSLEEKHKNILTQLNHDHEEQVTTLEDSLQESTSAHQKCEEDLRSVSLGYSETQKNLEKCRNELSVLRNQNKEKGGIIANLSEEVERRNDELCRLNQQMEKRVEQISDLQGNIENKKQRLEDRDQIIAELEKLLNKTTERYAGLVEKERIRLETNQCISVQVSPETLTTGLQVDFIVPLQSTVQTRRKSIVQDLWRSSADRVPT